MIPTKDIMPETFRQAELKALEDPRHIHNILCIPSIRVETDGNRS